MSNLTTFFIILVLKSKLADVKLTPYVVDSSNFYKYKKLSDLPLILTLFNFEIWKNLIKLKIRLVKMNTELFYGQQSVTVEA